MAATWRLVHEIVSARQGPARDQALVWRLTCTINVRLKGDQRQRMEEASEEFKRLLAREPPPTPGILEPDGGVVSGWDRPCANAHLV